MDDEIEDPENMFLERAFPDGIYNDVMQQFNSLGENALANREYNVNFFRSAQKDRFNGYKYVDKSGEEIETLLFGQICHSTHGTRLGAAGAYNQFSTPIKDSTNIKERIILSKPTFAEEDMMIFFNNQVATLSDLRVAERAIEKDNDERIGFVQEFIKAASDGEPMDLIILTIPRKYQVPPSSANEPERVTKKRLTDVGVRPEASESEKSNDLNIALGAFYPVHLLPDHSGPLFQHNKAKLVQHDLRDLNDQLIPPWKQHDKLRPGTLVLVKAGLVCWAVQDYDSAPIKKYYHLVAQSLRVLAESPLKAEIPTIPTLQADTLAKKKTKASSSAASKSSEIFTNFKTPQKRKHTS